MTPIRTIPSHPCVAVALLLLAVTPSAAQPAGIEWREPRLVAEGPAQKGPWRMNRSDYDYVDDPTVALGPDGAAYVAWVDQAPHDAFFQVYGPAGAPRLEVPVNLSRSPDTFTWLPRLALDPTDPDAVYVLWQEIIFSGGSHGGDILFARSTDGGRSFAPPLNLTKRSLAGEGKGRLTRERWHNGSLDLAVAADGTIHAAWTEYRGRLWTARSTDGGASFEAPERVAVAEDAGPARAPSLAIGPDGTIYLAWTVGEDPGADIRVAVSHDGGRSFGAPVAVAPDPGHADAPKLAVGAAGTVHLIFGQSGEGPFIQYDVRYTRSTDGGRSFEPPRIVSNPLPSGFHGANFPSLALDAAGNPVVSWELFPGPRTYPRGLGVARSPDGGNTFGEPSVVPGTVRTDALTGGRQGLLMRKLAVNATGDVAVVHSTFDRGEASRIWLIRGRLPE